MQHIEDLARVLKLKPRGRKILERYWSDKIALVWEVEDVYRAANEQEVALNRREAIELLHDLGHHYNPQYGIKWQDLTEAIKDQVLGRPLSKREIKGDYPLTPRK